ncbi:24494_t:CDS:2 [Racocetra persica]|uniref:24494_t:CDS:1 n=1 Tax=Racocetra persica TaxID=160502 RepID=A0ACA9N4Z6_9GLOM|nr:24494_t:CDS:2 [Racocetra persica]
MNPNFTDWHEQEIESDNISESSELSEFSKNDNCDEHLLSNCLMEFENLTLDDNKSNLLPMDIGSEISSNYQESFSSRGQKHGSGRLCRPRVSRNNHDSNTLAKKVSQQVNTQELSNFVFLQYKYSFCENGYPILSSHFYLIKKITPLMLFYEFFTADSLKQIVELTNKYYAIQNLAGTKRS